MKNRLFQIAGLATMLIASGWAQVNQPVKIKIPFDFNAGEFPYKAGDYTLVSVGNGVLKISSAAGNDATMQMTIPLRDHRTRRTHRLLFNRYGDRYFLSNIWPAGQDAGVKLRQGKTEREFAARTAKAEEVLLTTR